LRLDVHLARTDAEIAHRAVIDFRDVAAVANCAGKKKPAVDREAEESTAGQAPERERDPAG